MAWAEFWDMLHGRTWWELRKAGVKEKRKLSKREIDDTRKWLEETIKLKGWQ